MSQPTLDYAESLRGTLNEAVVRMESSGLPLCKAWQSTCGSNLPVLGYANMGDGITAIVAQARDMQRELLRGTVPGSRQHNERMETPEYKAFTGVSVAAQEEINRYNREEMERLWKLQKVEMAGKRI